MDSSRITSRLVDLIEDFVDAKIVAAKESSGQMEAENLDYTRSELIQFVDKELIQWTNHP